jgi:hypothetical protein
MFFIDICSSIAMTFISFIYAFCLLLLSESRFIARINRQVQTQLERVRAQNADDAAQHAAAIDVLMTDIVAQKAIVEKKKQV